MDIIREKELVILGLFNTNVKVCIKFLLYGG